MKLHIRIGGHSKNVMIGPTSLNRRAVAFLDTDRPTCNFLENNTL